MLCDEKENKKSIACLQNVMYIIQTTDAGVKAAYMNLKINKVLLIISKFIKKI